MPPRTSRSTSRTASKSESKPVSAAAAAPSRAGVKRNGTAAEPARKAADKKEEPPVKKRRTAQLNALPTPPENYESLSLFYWGTGDMGQFGTGPDDLDEKARPQLHKWFEEQMEEGNLGNPGGLETLAAGGMHTLAVDRKGQVRSWGINDNAALGRITATVPDPNNEGSTLPAEDFETWPLVVEELEKQGFRAVKVAAGDSVSVAVSDSGELRAWGSFRSNDGVLGFDGVPGHAPFQFKPIALPALAKVKVVDVACGADHVLALTSEGHVYVWGNGQQNQLGRRVMDRRRLNGLEPERLGLRHIVHVAAGIYHSFAVDKSGTVYAWGLNTFHQTGISGRDANEEMIIRPQAVAALSPEEHGGARVVQISGGEHHSLFLFDNGEVWGCGRCDANELGLAPDHPAQAGLAERREEVRAEREEAVKTRQAKLDKILSDPMVDESEKEAAEQALASAKAALGIPTGEFVPEVVRIAFPPIPEEYEVVPDLPAWEDNAAPINPIASIAAGTRHNIAVSRSGHVYSWGLGNQCQLGLGREETAETPSLVRSKWLRPYKAVAASAGGQHCVLLAKKKGEGEAI